MWSTPPKNSLKWLFPADSDDPPTFLLAPPLGLIFQLFFNTSRQLLCCLSHYFVDIDGLQRMNLNFDLMMALEDKVSPNASAVRCVLCQLAHVSILDGQH